MSSPNNSINIAEKIVIPAIGIAISSITAFMAFSISNTQSEIQKELNDIQFSQFNKELQQKYIEIFYAEIATGDENRQKIALSLLLEIEPEVGEKLNRWALKSGVLQEEAQTEAESVNAKIQLLIGQVLKDFEIGIYYKSDSPNAALHRSQAEEIKQKLIEIGILESRLKVVDQWSGEISDYQIRYERDREDEVADALQKVLEEIYPQQQFSKQTVRGESHDFISIFLGP